MALTSKMDTPEKNRAPFSAALALVIGNMIGTGVFVSLGFQAGDMPSGFVIALLWLTGGVLAFCGAVNYAELTAAFPKSGGEYQLLSQVYHPGVGFVSGWVSFIAGFPAPVALNALLIGGYVCSIFGVESGFMEKAVAAGVVIMVTGAHLISVSFSGRFQSISTALKVLLVAALAVSGFLIPEGQPVSFLPRSGDGKLIWQMAFFNSLVYVLYAYSGWNAACYVAGEIKNPGRNVPRALLLGTGIVTLLYIAVNAAMIYSTPVAELAAAGPEAARVAAGRIFGPAGGALIAGLIGLGLISSISAMTWAGPRVTQQVGQDFPQLSWLARTSPSSVPVTAVGLQCLMALVLVLSGDVQQLIDRTIFLLEVMTLLTVFGVVHLRSFRPQIERPLKAWGYPFTTILYLAMVGWTMAVLLRNKPEETRSGLLLLLVGAMIYFAVRPKPNKA